MERHAYQEEIAAAAAEEQAVAAIQQERLNMAKALLNKHNPSWFADTEGQDKTTTDAASVEDVKRCATAAAAKQRAAAMALLKEHNADWFGDDTEAKKQKSFALFRRVKGSRKMRKNDSSTSRARESSTQAEKPREKAVLQGALARLIRGTPSGRIRSESPPSSIPRSANRLARKTTSGEHQVTPGSASSRRSEGYRTGSWFSRHSRSASQLLSSDPTSPAGMVHGRIATSSCTTPLPQPSLMDILENTAEEPMSLRSMLRFARENLMEENVLFYLEVVSFKTGGGGRCEYLTNIKRIHELYIQHNSKREINISGQMRLNMMATVEAILSADGQSSGGSTGAPRNVELQAEGGEVEREPAETNVVGGGSACFVGAAIRAAAEGVEAGAGERFEAATPAAATPAATGSEAGGGGRLEEASAAPATATTTAAKTVGVEDVDVPTAPKLGHADGQGAGASVAEGVIADVGQEGSRAPGSPPHLGAVPTQSPTHRVIVSGNSSSSIPATESATPASVEGERERGASLNAVSAGRFTVLGKCRSGSPSSKEISSSSSSSRDDEQEGNMEEEMRLRRDSTMWDDRCLHGADAAAEDDFNASVEIELLGLGIGPGGGYGDRTVFDSALLEIFVILRHQVYPKFVARVAGRSTCHSSTSSTTVHTATLSTASILSTKPVEASRVSLSQSEEVAKAVRAELAKCYF